MEISGKKMVIVGLGNIGLEVAKRAKAFGLVVTGISRSGVRSAAEDHSQDFERVLSIRELDRTLEDADIVVDTLPLTPDTRSLFNREMFHKIKRGAIFLNVGRGQTVDESALVESIEQGRLRLVGLDVFATEPLPRNSPLWGFDNVIISPHRAGRSELMYEKAVPLLRENLTKYSRGEPLTNLVERSRGY